MVSHTITENDQGIALAPNYESLDIDELNFPGIDPYLVRPPDQVLPPVDTANHMAIRLSTSPAPWLSHTASTISVHQILILEPWNQEGDFKASCATVWYLEPDL